MHQHATRSQSSHMSTKDTTRRVFFWEILYKNIPIIAIQHGKMDFVDTFGNFSHTVTEIHSSPSGKFPYTY